MPRSFRRRMLVVDDDETLLATTAAVLSREGYDVETARDGFEALALLRGGLPDLLISDLMQDTHAAIRRSKRRFHRRKGE